MIYTYFKRGKKVLEAITQYFVPNDEILEVEPLRKVQRFKLK